MADKTDKNWLERLSDWLAHWSNIQTVGQLFAAFGVTSFVTSMLPGGWHPPQYWAAFGTVLFGSAFVVGVALRGMKAVVDRFAPRAVEVTPYGGLKASIQISHSGWSATYKVSGRIVSLVDGTPNPAPQKFLAELHPAAAGKNGDFEIKLSDSDYAHVVVADIGENTGALGGGTTWIQIRRGKYPFKTPIPDTGAIVEIEIKSAQTVSGVGAWRYRVCRDYHNNEYISIEKINA